MKVCSYCGRENDAAVTHCFECGTEFVAERADMAPVLRWGRTWIKAACGYIAVILSGEIRRWWTILTPHPALSPLRGEGVGEPTTGICTFGSNGVLSTTYLTTGRKTIFRYSTLE
jgi:hypothetical protein